jgi:hypothetical protein
MKPDNFFKRIGFKINAKAAAIRLQITTMSNSIYNWPLVSIKCKSQCHVFFSADEKFR